MNWFDSWGLIALDSPNAALEGAIATGNYAEAAVIADAMGLTLKGAQVAALQMALYAAAQDDGDSSSGQCPVESSPATPPDPDDDDSNRFAERKLYRGAKHGLKWKEGPARATKTGNPQGQFGSRADIDWAVDRARSIRPGQSSIVELPNNHSSIVHLPDGRTVRAVRVFIKVYKNGKVHAYPML